MKIKNLISNSAYWTINKSLAKDIGLHATIVLQHFIDLQSNFFEDGGFYQQQKRIVEDLPITLDYLRKAVKVLVDKGFLIVEKKGIPAKNHYTVLEDNIFAYLTEITSGASEAPLEMPQKDHLLSTRGTTNSKNKNSKNKNTKSESDKSDSNAKRMDQIKNLYWKKLVPEYPTNRIGNRQNGLKQWLKLEDKEMVLAIKNLDRYLKLAGSYVKRLDNYLEQRCFTEEWLKAQNETNNKKTDTNKTKKFKANYDNF